jgi:Arc/MetJ family transcription regulator
MPTNLAIDDRLIEEAKATGHHKTKKEAVNTALREYIKLQQRKALLRDEAQVDFWPNYNHKRLRQGRWR